VAAMPESIQQTIKDYINQIRNQITVEKAFVFGSYAWGTYTSDSC
jgi:predicted nucleotidyltransferase